MKNILAIVCIYIQRALSDVIKDLCGSPELQFQIAITCFLDWHDDSCMLDLKLHNSTR